MVSAAARALIAVHAAARQSGVSTFARGQLVYETAATAFAFAGLTTFPASYPCGSRNDNWARS
jgi:hypothetical protein